MKIMEELWLLSQLINLLRWWRKLIWSIFTIQWNLKKTHSSAFLTHWHFLPSQWTLDFPVYGSYYGVYLSILMKTKRIVQEKVESMICWQFVIIEFVSRLANLMEVGKLDDGDGLWWFVCYQIQNWVKSVQTFLKIFSIHPIYWLFTQKLEDMSFTS